MLPFCVQMMCLLILVANSVVVRTFGMRMIIRALSSIVLMMISIPVFLTLGILFTSTIGEVFTNVLAAYSIDS